MKHDPAMLYAGLKHCIATKEVRGIAGIIAMMLDGTDEGTECLITSMESLSEEDRAYVFSLGEWTAIANDDGSATLSVVFHQAKPN